MMEKNKISPTESCENCLFQSRIIQKYSEEIVDLQRQVSALSARLLKYESDPPAESLCVIKIENKSDDEFVCDQNSIQNVDDETDCKDFYSETSRDDNTDLPGNDYDTEGADPDDDDVNLSESEVKKVIKREKSSTRRMKKCKTCNEELSSSRALLRHNHEIHGK